MSILQTHIYRTLFGEVFVKIINGVKDIVKNRRSSFDVFNKEIIALDKAIDKLKDDIAKYFFLYKR